MKEILKTNHEFVGIDEVVCEPGQQKHAGDSYYHTLSSVLPFH